MKYYALIIGLCFSKIAYAQFSDTTTHLIEYTTTGTLNRTQDGNAYLLNNALRFGVKKNSMSLNTNHSWLFGKQNASLTNNDYSGGLDINLYKTFPHFFYWGLANYNTSYSLKIRNQLLAGLGIAYSLFDSENAYLNISDGILYDNSDLYLTDNRRDVYDSFRNSLRVQFKFNINELLTINGSSFWQPSLQFENDYIIRSTTSLSINIRKWLALTSTLNYNKISRTARENLLFSYGLTMQKYF